MLADLMKSGWRRVRDYSEFERIALISVMVMVAATTVFLIVATAVKLVTDVLLGEIFPDRAVLQDTFGFILVILILLEFNHSVLVALTERSGAVQARILVRITILVVVRKLMLMDFAAVSAQILLGFGGLLLALGGLYWLLSQADRPYGGGSLDVPHAERAKE